MKYVLYYSVILQAKTQFTEIREWIFLKAQILKKHLAWESSHIHLFWNKQEWINK